MAKSDQITDSERNYYLAGLTETEGQIDDSRRDFYLSELTETEGQVTDLFVEWLEAQGITKTNKVDNWRDFLVSQGYSGNVVDMTKQFFNDND